jgi:hypothetical protein
MAEINASPQPLPTGKMLTVYKEVSAAAGIYSRTFTLDADAVLVSLFVSSISTGSLDVVIYTETEEGKEYLVGTFPSITSATSNLLIKKSAVALSRIRIQATLVGGPATYEIRARGIAIGEASVRIQGAVSGSSSSVTATNTTGVLIPSNLADRTSLIIKNNSNAGTLFIGFTPAEATLTNGYPLGPHESLGIDIEAGTVIYSVADVPSIDIRLLQAGG